MTNHKTMTQEEYFNYDFKTGNLLAHLQFWLEMVEENDIKPELESEISLAKQLQQELKEHYQAPDDIMSNIHGQDDCY